MEKTFDTALAGTTMTLDERRLKNFKNHFFYVEGLFYLLQGIYAGGLQIYVVYCMTKVFQLNYVTIASLSALIAMPVYFKMFTGLLSDRVPIGKFGRRKPYLIFGGILYIPSFLMLARITTYSPIWIVAVILCYSCFVLVDGTADALTVDVTPDKYVSKMQGFANGGRYIGMAIGVAIASFLSPVIGWNAVIIIVGVAAVGQSFIMMLIKEIKNEDIGNSNEEGLVPIKIAFKMAFGSKGTWLGIIFGVLFCGCFGAKGNLNALIMNNVSREIYGLSSLVSFIFVAVGSLGGGIVVSKRGGFSNKNTLIIFIISWILYLPWLLVNNNWDNTSLLILAQCGLGLGTGLVHVCSYGIVMRLCYQSIEGFMFAIFTSVFNIGMVAIAPNVIAYFGETLGMGIIPAMYTMIPVTLLGMLIVPAINKTIEERKTLE